MNLFLTIYCNGASRHLPREAAITTGGQPLFLLRGSRRQKTFAFGRGKRWASLRSTQPTPPTASPEVIASHARQTAEETQPQVVIAAKRGKKVEEITAQ